MAGFIDTMAGWFGFSRGADQARTAPPPFGIRRYQSARTDRLSEDWITPGNMSGDAAMDGKLERIRNRAREAERDQPLANRWLTLLENNVMGSEGIALQMCVKDPDTVGARNRVIPGQPDHLANQAIESEWRHWGEARFEIGRGVTSDCCFSGEFSLAEIEQLALRSAFRDGAMFLRLHLGSTVNRFGIAVQPLEIDHLDIRYNADLQNGHKIRMGIEKDATGRTVAWHLFKTHPGDNYSLRDGAFLKRERVAADRIIHLYVPQRFSQSTGVPQIHSVLQRMKMLDGYNEAELVAARAGACKMGFLTSNNPEEYVPDSEGSNGEQYMEMQEGTIEKLPMGYDFKPWDPNHPNSAYPDFTKAAMREISGGLNLSYNSLANDLEGVNYSSIRAGVLEDREQYKKVQSWFIRRLRAPLFQAWLFAALLNRAIKLPNGSALPFLKYDKFKAAKHIGRRWAWVDPAKDMAAIEKALAMKLTSHRRELGKQGIDIAEIAAEIAADEELGFRGGEDEEQQPGKKPPAKATGKKESTTEDAEEE